MNAGMKQVYSALRNMLTRGVVSTVNGATKLRTIQAKLFARETKDNLEHFEPFGFSAEPEDGAELLTAFFAGDRSCGIVLVVADRRYRPTNMKPGESVQYDSLGQMVYLTKGGIVIKGAGRPMMIQDTAKLTIDTPQVEMKGNLKVNGKIEGDSIKSASTDLDSHVHDGVRQGDDKSGPPVGGSS